MQTPGRAELEARAIVEQARRCAQRADQLAEQEMRALAEETLSTLEGVLAEAEQEMRREFLAYVIFFALDARRQE